MTSMSLIGITFSLNRVLLSVLTCLHSTTLQGCRLPNVTTTVTKSSGERTSENAVKAKFAEFIFPDVGE
jgi:hypothetical protein